MIAATVYTCTNDQEYPYGLQAMLLLLKSEGLSSHQIVDVKKVMTLTKGRCNPVDGFVFVMYDETVVQDIYALCKWIDEKGLRRC